MDNNGLVIAVETTAANQPDSKSLLALLDKAKIRPGTRVNADKAYCGQKHRENLKSLGIKNGIQDKAVKNKPLTQRQLQRNRLIDLSSLGSRAHLWQSSTLVWQQNSALPG